MVALPHLSVSSWSLRAEIPTSRDRYDQTMTCAILINECCGSRHLPPGGQLELSWHPLIRM